MKKVISLIVVALMGMVIVGCAQSSSSMQTSQKEQPTNIDKNNVGITSGENADQTDPTLIEGNLENNDFKN